MVLSGVASELELFHRPCCYDATLPTHDHPSIDLLVTNWLVLDYNALASYY